MGFGVVLGAAGVVGAGGGVVGFGVSAGAGGGVVGFGVAAGAGEVAGAAGVDGAVVVVGAGAGFGSDFDSHAVRAVAMAAEASNAVKETRAEFDRMVNLLLTKLRNDR